MQRVFLAGHDPRVSEAIATGLAELGYSVEVVHEPGLAIAAARKSTSDVAFLPSGGPMVCGGREVMAQLAANVHGVPILVITDGAAAADHHEGGAVKAYTDPPQEAQEPFALARIAQRLQLRIESMLGKPPDGRSSRDARAPSTLRVADLEIERSARRVFRAGIPISVTRREYSLLEYLALHPDVPVTRGMIAREIWQVESRATPLDNVIDVHVGRLRRKLTVAGRSELIHTIRGVGYRLSGKPGGGCSCN